MSNLPDTTAAPAQRSGFHSPGFFGQYPVVGLIMMLFGGGLFCVLAISLQTHSGMILIDPQIANSLHIIALQSSPFIVQVTIFGYYAGEEVIVGIAVVLVIYFLHKRYWMELFMVVITWGGEAGLWVVTSNYFARSRPVFAVPVWHQMTAPSFPSGHSFAAVLCYGFLAYICIPKLSSRFWKVAVILLALLIVLYIGFSRVFVGDHYPSDILAGYALGIAWGSLAYTSVEVVARRIRQRKADSAQMSYVT